MNQLVSFFSSPPTLAGLIASVVIGLSRVPSVNRRLARLLDPVIRWWSRGALTDQVGDREREIMFRRTQDVDIMESYLIEVSRWMVEARIDASEKGVQLRPMPPYREYKAQWIREHPDYAETRRLDLEGLS